MLALLLGLVLGLFLGLLAGALFARSDLRAMSAELDSLRGVQPSGASVPELPARAPSHAEGR